MIRTGAWENHAATVWGPFCIIYGFGAAALYWISGQASDLPIWAQFLLYALIGAAVEYLGSWGQELVFGSVSWDYSDRLLNINGRICLRQYDLPAITPIGEQLDEHFDDERMEEIYNNMVFVEKKGI